MRKYFRLDINYIILLVGVLNLSLPVSTTAALLEEVVVTAKKREESLQDVSISVTAFSKDTMRDVGLATSNDLGQFIPGVEIRAVAGGEQAKIWIRGSGGPRWP